MRTPFLPLLLTALCLVPPTTQANDIEPGKEFYTVVYALKPIVLDGSLAEWSGVPVLADPKFATPKYSGTNAAPNYVLFEEYNGGTWTGPDDQTSAVQIVYDADNVYFGFVVTDDYHENSASSAWNGDSVQLMIASADRTAQIALYNYALGGVEDALGDVIVQHEAGPGGTEAVVSRNIATKRTTYEIKLPKESLGLTSLKGGPQFGLGMAINDGDQLTPGQKGWGGLGAHSIVFGKTPSETALITLAKGNDIEPGKEFYTAVRTTTPITLDGKLTDWTGVPVLSDPKFATPKYSGTNEAPKYVLFEEYSGGTWTGPDDQTSAVQIVYDADNIYFGFVVTDDYHENAANSAWNGDSVQLMIASADRTVQVALYNYALGGIEGATTDVIVQHEAGPGGTEAVVTRDGTTKKTYYEIKLPADALGFTAPLAVGTKFGLGMAINDGDQLTPGQKGWGGLGAHSIVFGKTPSETAQVTLGSSVSGTTDLLFLSAINPDILSFTFRVNDKGTSVLNPASAKLTIDGQAATITASAKKLDATDFAHQRATQFAAGTHTYSIEVKDTQGATVTDTGTFRAVTVPTLTAVQRAASVDKTKPGFIWRMFQNEAFPPTDLAEAELALAGQWKDTAGVTVPNLTDRAATGIASAAGTADATLIRFEIPTVLNLNPVAGVESGNFIPDDQIPGIPGTAAGEIGIVAEILTFIDLPAGLINMGVNNEDGFRTQAGYVKNPVDGAKLGEFNATSSTTDHTFKFVVQDAGVYGFRTVWRQSSGTARFEWFTVKADGTKVLLNDSANGGLMAYRVGVAATPPPPGVPIAANLSAGPARTTAGDGLVGEYWQRGINTIKVDGNTVATNRIDAQIAKFGAPSGTFNAKVLSYTGNDLSAMPAWLSTDNPSFMGRAGNLDDGAFRFSGFININTPGSMRIGTVSDDGSRVKIGGIDVVNNDGGHGDATVDENVNFAAAGIYPIEITYFNGDWTSDNAAGGAPAGVNHSGNPDPSVHGGANFHLRIDGATITAAQVGKYLFTAPTTNYIQAGSSMASPRTTPGDGLFGEYWQRGINTIKTDGNTVAANRIDTQIASFGEPSGTFVSKLLNYTGNDLTTMPAWLAGDRNSFMGKPGHLDDGAFRFSGFINVKTAGKLKFGTTSDDGSRIRIAGMDIVNNDGGHGDATVDADVTFAAAGVYPIEVTFFNGDWTSDNAAGGAASGVSHSGNPDPSVHGGANFHLRIDGVNVTSAQVSNYLYQAPMPNYIHPRDAGGPALALTGDGLKGEYWQRGVNTIKTDGNTVAANRIDTQILGFGPPTGTFNSKLLVYTGNDLSAMPGWLGSDSASYVGPAGNLDDGAFRFKGYINVTMPGKLKLGTTSDDGSRVKVAGLDVVANDGGHGDATVDADVTFAAAGVYPIEITFFNGDWTSDNAAGGAASGVNHSGNLDPSVHGGANFRFRVNGADINAEWAKSLFQTADGQTPMTLKNIAWVSFHAGDNAPTTAAAAVGFTRAPDVAYTDLLKENGYNVTRFQSVDNANLAALNSADLVIISRSVASSHYQQAAETAAWHGLKKPVIVMNGYIMRNSRLGFTTGATIPDTTGRIGLKVNDPAHPIFAGVALTSSNTMANPYAHLVPVNGTNQLGISVNTDPLAGEGKVLATVGTTSGTATGGTIIGEWNTGAKMGNATADVLGGPRLVFLSGSREFGITSEATGVFDLEPDGCRLFLNSVAYMLSSGAKGELKLTPITATSYINTPDTLNNGRTESLGVAIAANKNVIVGWEDDGELINDQEAVWTLLDGTGKSITPTTTVTSRAENNATRDTKFLAYFRTDKSATGPNNAWGPKVKANPFGDGIGMGATAFSLGLEIDELGAINLQADGSAGDFPAVQLLNNDGSPVTFLSGVADADADPEGDIRIGDWDYLGNGNVVIVGESRQDQVLMDKFGGAAAARHAIYRVVDKTGKEIKAVDIVSEAKDRNEIWHGVGVTKNGFGIRFANGAGRATLRLFDNNGVPTSGNIDIATLAAADAANGGGRGDGAGFHGNGNDAYVAIGAAGTTAQVTVIAADGKLRYTRDVAEGASLASVGRVDAAIDADGTVLAVFAAKGTAEGSVSLIYGRLLGSDGTPVGDVFLVSETEIPGTATADSIDPRVALRGGLAAVVWESKSHGTGAPSVVASRLFTLGTPAPVAPIKIGPVTLAADSITISWEGGTGPFLVQGKIQLSDANWTDIVTTSSRSAKIPLAAPQAFFRIVDGTSKTVKLYKAVLSGAAETPAIDTQAAGIGMLIVDGTTGTYVVNYGGLKADATNSHIHGPADETASAGVMVAIQKATGRAGLLIGAVTLTAAQAADIEAGKTYFNIHSSFAPGGEIRGQIKKP